MTAVDEPWRGHTVTITFSTSEYHRLIDADALAETGDLAAFSRAAVLDKVGLIEHVVARAGVR